MPRPVLLITSNHTLLPLWEKLHETFDLCIIGPNAGLAQDLGLAGAFPLAKYSNPDIGEEATNIAYRVAARLHETPNSEKIAETVRGSFADDAAVPNQLKPENVRGWWPAMVGEHVKGGAGVVACLKALLADREVLAGIVHEDVTFEARVVVQYLKSRGVTTIHVPHASCFYIGEQWDIHTESICDYLLAAGKYMYDWYAKWGYAEDRIRVTGAPQLDRWYTDKFPSKKEARTVLGIGEDESVMMYATTWSQLTSSRSEFEQEHYRNLGVACKTAVERKCTMVLSLHPGESQGQEAFYLQKMKEYGVRGCVVRGYIEYVLRAVDFVVAPVSNVVVDAAILGVPSVYIATEGFEMEGGPIRYVDNLSRSIDFTLLYTARHWGEFAKLINDRHGEEESAASRAVQAIVDIVTRK